MSALREWQDEADAQRTRADAAEAECARLRAELAASIERGKARWGVAAELADVAAERDALAADNARLRAIVEGRTVAPTIREARAHCHGSPGSRGAFVATRLDWGAHGGARVATGLQPLPGATHRWIALDASGRPCAWPTPALDAAEAECVRLRAIVEGREHPPTPDEAEAHYRAGGGWLYARAEGCRASVAAVPMTVRSIACAADYQRETLRWWPLDATGRPCPWPTVLDAGEGR